MNVADLTSLFDYGYWANAKLFSVVSGLTAEQFTGDVAGSYGSIRNTLVHMLSAEAGWLDRCGGPVRGPALEPLDFPDFTSVQAGWEKVERQVREFLARLSDADLGRSIEFSLGGGTRVMPLGQLLHHAANHGVHHRGQIALLLRVLGLAPGNVDLLLYYSRPIR